MPIVANIFLLNIAISGSLLTLKGISFKRYCLNVFVTIFDLSSNDSKVTVCDSSSNPEDLVTSVPKSA